MLIFRIFREHTQFQLIVIPFFFQLCQTRNFLTAQIKIRTGFIQKVNGLIGKVAVSDISFRQNHALTGNFRTNSNAMECRIIFRNTLHDLAGFLNGRLRNNDRLESALQGSILLNMLAILIKGCGSDQLHFTSGKSGFQNIAGIHRTFCVTRTN